MEIENSNELIGRQKFLEIFEDVINDRGWCREHGIDYVSPNYFRVRAELTKELCNKKSRNYKTEA